MLTRSPPRFRQVALASKTHKYLTRYSFETVFLKLSKTPNTSQTLLGKIFKEKNSAVNSYKKKLGYLMLLRDYSGNNKVNVLRTKFLKSWRVIMGFAVK